ncbi:MAG TPA: glutamate 5-kinase [Holophaga sp.]|jgi:glutamate 5-kinase|nr:glutamate 5-kinase [Holophaga sp.]
MKTAASSDDRTTLSQARRIVVKLGTNVIMGHEGKLALSRLYGIMEAVAALRRAGKEVILVSSGAVGLGAQALKLENKPRTLELKQAFAAVGQGRLMALYQDGFRRLEVTAAQVLLTEDDFGNRKRFLNLRGTLEKLLELGVVPVINENDTVSTAELETPGDWTRPIFGDNDKLSALVASGLDADLLLILSDVDGLYTANPSKDPDAKLIPLVTSMNAEIEGFADGQSSRGRGGMASKLAAVRVATQAGTRVVIASGAKHGILADIFAGHTVGTLFLAEARMKGVKRWVAHASHIAGRVRVNSGAEAALRGGRASLLAAGVISLEGDFQRDDVVAIADEQGHDFARGAAVMGHLEAETLLQKHGKRVMVSRDTIVPIEIQ